MDEKTDGKAFLDEMIAAIGEAMKTIPESMREDTGPFEPPPWPREQMTVMRRFLVAEAGLPERCPDRRCRRKGYCHMAGGDDGESCEELWDDALAGRVLAACLALGLSWVYESQRKHAMTDMLLKGEPKSESRFPA